jgi:GT2 family glycosyltransferase
MILSGQACDGACEAFPPSLVLVPVSRWPTVLPAETADTVLNRPLPTAHRTGSTPEHGHGPRHVSIIVVTCNSLVFTRLCLESVLVNTNYDAYELVVVDNGSDDGTPAYLRTLARRFPHVQVLFNERNLGFAAAANQGLTNATGEVFVLLNNDTVVPPGWLEPLLDHLDDPDVGMAGPVTNRAGNEAQIEALYRTYGEMLGFARERRQSHRGESFKIRVVTMFCAALRRDVYERVGPLDERFSVGLFEDDDYAMRLRAARYRLICAEDVFVHHFGQASFGQLAADGTYGRLFHDNCRRWEEKWREPWQPYERRSRLDYQLLKSRIRELVEMFVPRDGRMLVVSKGDDELLDLNGRPAWHFPQAAGGGYSGCNPKDGDAAIAHLEELAGSADFLLIPATALWWLDYYAGLKEHLHEHYRLLVSEADTCLIVELKETHP